jgi:succinate-semialdehyde dehydrogenase/glutarate-semialdehyde dehydrogenase
MEAVARPAGAERRIVSHNPATGEALGEVPVLGPAEVRAAVERAREAQRDWARVEVEDRGRRLMAFRDAVVARADEIAEALAREGGKTKIEALAAEVFLVADLTTYFAKRAHRILAPRPIALHLMKHRRSYVHYAPRGVVGIISPWNFPFSIPMGETVMSLLAGNAVVLKPSEVTPLIALKAKEIYDATGLPQDLFQVVTGDGSTGAALIDAGVNQIIFTGSVATGKRIAAACGERLIPCTLELGGKAPVVVCEDADLERTARALVWGAFFNSGQVCASVERAYVPERIHDRLVDKIRSYAATLRQGDPLSFDTDVGAITFTRQLEIAEAQVKDAVEKGATVLAGGERRSGPGQFFAPTILVGCRHDMAVMKQETFGPLLPIMKVKDEEEAVRLANDSHLGLVAYVFGSDRERTRRIAERIESGTVMVNDVLASYGYPETPWGGVKQSGIGRTHSEEGLRDLCEARHVNYDLLRPGKREIWWYPYSEKTFRLGKRILKGLFGKGLGEKLGALVFGKGL